MKEIKVSVEDARVIVAVMKTGWVPLEHQKAVYELVQRLEREIES